MRLEKERPGSQPTVFEPPAFDAPWSPEGPLKGRGALRRCLITFRNWAGLAMLGDMLDILFHNMEDIKTPAIHWKSRRETGERPGFYGKRKKARTASSSVCQLPASRLGRRARQLPKGLPGGLLPLPMPKIYAIF